MVLENTLHAGRRLRFGRVMRKAATTPSRDAITVQALLEALPQPLLVLDGFRRILCANAPARAALGDDLVGSVWQSPPGATERPLCLDSSAASGSRARVGTLVSLQGSAEHRPPLDILGHTQAALAHQIRSPLTAAGLTVDHLLLVVSDRGELQRLERVRRSLSSIEQHVRNALVFVRGELAERATFSVAELSAALKDAWHELLPAGQCDWKERYRLRDALSGDRSALVSALTNLVENARAIAGSDAEIRIRLEAIEANLVVTIADDGPGMSPEFLARARQPFVSGRPGGTGLGLPIAEAVIKAHGGRLDIESAAGCGTICRIELPLIGASHS